MSQAKASSAPSITCCQNRNASPSHSLPSSCSTNRNPSFTKTRCIITKDSLRSWLSTVSLFLHSSPFGLSSSMSCPNRTDCSPPFPADFGFTSPSFSFSSLPLISFVCLKCWAMLEKSLVFKTANQILTSFPSWADTILCVALAGPLHPSQMCDFFTQFCFAFMGVVWGVWWFICLRKCSRNLKALPYLSTRYRQVQIKPCKPFCFCFHFCLYSPSALPSHSHPSVLQLSFSFFVWLSLWLGLYMLASNVYALTQLQSRYIYVSSRDYNDSSQMVCSVETC
jgi:hypothetical protein